MNRETKATKSMRAEKDDYLSKDIRNICSRMVQKGFYISNSSNPARQNKIEVIATEVSVYNVRMQPSRNNVLILEGTNYRTSPAACFFEILSNGKPRYIPYKEEK